MSAPQERYVDVYWQVIGPMENDPSWARYIATSDGTLIVSVEAGKQSPEIANHIVDSHNRSV